MKKLLFISLLVSLFLPARAQLTALPEEFYKEKIALMDEFFERFDDRASEATDSAEARKDAMIKVLRLFNAENFASPSDPMLQAAEEFAAAVVDDSVFISYPDTLWSARATCHGFYRKKPVTFTLTLKVASRGVDMYRWVISGAEGELFTLPPLETGKGFYIFPDSHETNFMSLSDLTDSQTESITLYATPGTKIDPLTVFMTMVYGGELKIDHVKPLEFIFTQVPGWEFTVRYFERDNLNSGWLIDTITKK